MRASIGAALLAFSACRQEAKPGATSTEPQATVLATADARPYDLVANETHICWSTTKAASCIARAGGSAFPVPRAAGRLVLREGVLWSNGANSLVTRTELANPETKVLATNIYSWSGFVGDETGLVAWGSIHDADRKERSGVIRIMPDGAPTLLVETSTSFSAPPTEGGRGLVAADRTAIYYVDRNGSDDRLHRFDKSTKKDIVLHEGGWIRDLWRGDTDDLFFASAKGLCVTSTTMPIAPACYPDLHVFGPAYMVRERIVHGVSSNQSFGTATTDDHGGFLDVCHRGNKSECKRYFADAGMAGIAFDGAAVLTFRQKTRRDPWELVRFTP